jgi:hypothetical protein
MSRKENKIPASCPRTKKRKTSPNVGFLLIWSRGSDGRYHYVGQTEWIKDNSNPEFHSDVHILYAFERKQKVRFMLLDIDDPKNVSVHLCLCVCVCFFLAGFLWGVCLCVCVCL